ncbi:MAG: hypothetical protein K1X94_31035 [Sandaracinaceae bacterium]|nr:hypothetical protein [Sandaracinaceae bacterium]
MRSSTCLSLLAALSLVFVASGVEAQLVVTDALPGLGGDPRHEATDPHWGLGTRVEANLVTEGLRLHADLASARRRHLAMLRRYANAMQFPVNADVPGRATVLVDEAGRLDAVASLLARDGERALLDTIAAQDVHVRVPEVVGGPWLAWMLRSGFTQEELSRMQVPTAHVPSTLPARERRRAIDDEKRRVRAVLLALAFELERGSEAALTLATARALASELGTPGAMPGPAAPPARPEAVAWLAPTAVWR